jgi:hypothetical protein
MSAATQDGDSLVVSTGARNDTQRIASAQTYARVAGVLFLITMAAGGFGEGYAPSVLIRADDAAITVANLSAHEGLYRLSFAAYLVEALCDVVITLIFFELLRPVSRGLSLLAAFFGILSTALYAVCEIFYFGTPRLLSGGAAYLQAFSTDQLNSLALLSLKLFDTGAGLFLVFYGVAWIIRGWLMIRSGYLPWVLGLLMLLGGLGFATMTFAIVLAPRFANDLLLFMMAPGGVLLSLWLLFRGIDPAKWAESAKVER